jgi:hypothetical protein
MFQHGDRLIDFLQLPTQVAEDIVQVEHSTPPGIRAHGRDANTNLGTHEPSPARSECQRWTVDRRGGLISGHRAGRGLPSMLP